MTGFVYLAALLASIGAMALIDARWRVAFWRHPAAAAIAVGTGTALLLVWDLVGIGFGVFFRGDSVWATGVLLAPELPVEEPVFLAFLCYLALVVVLGAERLLAVRHRAARPVETPVRDGSSPTADATATDPGADAAREARA
ncbi:lycopene cyclase domain-containing protein [Agromyces allii]|uniref:Lycopene cyclase domain-containing protein n=1 Tax=Agromyces allii TaxID=393607 RepID=A0ABN2RB82_9MICO|nr:lycopene cyclase domain-containing protein [Agromyces allii]